MNEWQPIETAPRDRPVIVAIPQWVFADIGLVDVLGRWYSPIDGVEHSPAPTHWMPLPEPPK